MREYVIDIEETRTMRYTVFALSEDTAEEGAWDKYNKGEGTVVSSSEEIVNVEVY